MKRKIGEIYNKPIVIGDKNLVTSNEIHKSELSGSQSGGVTQDNFEYFTYDENTASSPVLLYAQYVKLESASSGTKVVAPYTIAIAELKAQLSDLDIVAVGVNLKERIIMKYGETFADGTVLDSLKQNGVTEEVIDAIPRITKEEFYSLN